MSVFGLAKSQPAEPAQKGHVLVWPPEHFTVVYTLWFFLYCTFFLKCFLQQKCLENVRCHAGDNDGPESVMLVIHLM